jgi:hypothetical protein
MTSSISSISTTQMQMVKPTAAEIKQHNQEMFKKMDTNGDGSVDKAEFTAFGKQMAEKMGGTGKSNKSDEMFSSMDTDGDGTISQAEAEAFTPPAPPQGPPPSKGTSSQGVSDETLTTLLDSLDKSTESNSDKWAALKAAIQQFASSSTTDTESAVNLLA